MAPIHSRQLLAWTLPTIAALLSYLWYKRKRIGAPSDPGDKETATKGETIAELDTDHTKGATAPKSIPDNAVVPAEGKTVSRSLSGVDSSPIDIVIPKELRSIKTAPVVISDEDLDFEIEKVKSMKNTNPIELFNKARTSNGSPSSKSNNNDELNVNKNIGGAEKSDSEPTTLSPTKEMSVKIEASPFECKQSPPTKIDSGSAKTTPKKQKNKNKSSMAQKDIAIVEEKLNTLTLQCNGDQETQWKKNGEKKKKKSKSRSSSGCDRGSRRQSSERDSANHSPSDVMLASHSLSSISDNHSEGSNDSGKGGSDVATPPPSRTPGTDSSVSGDLNVHTIYEFVIPQSLVGKLIGKKGSFVTLINSKTNAQILVKGHPTDETFKVCAVEGSQNEIDRALRMIRERFPIKRFPNVTLEQVSFMHPLPTVPLFSDHLYLKLVEGINNDTIMSCMVTPNHLFLQQPAHPSFPALSKISEGMNECYLDPQSPLLPNPIPENTVCVAYSVDSWFRAMVLSTDPETETSYVKFLDYGGFAYVENSWLRQIRYDFMLLPFQAAECILANIKPVGDKWQDAAYDFVANLAKGKLIYTQIIEYTEEGIPLVHCYIVMAAQYLVFLNQKLVKEGFAEWVSYSDQSQLSEEGANAMITQEVVQCS